MAAVAGALGVASPALADCDIGLVQFGSAITTVQLSVTNGYADGAAEVIDELHGNIECLRFAPPPNLWADWLFLVALTRHAQGREDWRAPLDRALAINPNLSRGVIGSGHPLFSYSPGESKVEPTPLPYDKAWEKVHVDGVPVQNVLPAPGGFHLIQINNGVWWDSMIIEGSKGRHDLWVPRRQPKDVRLWLALVGGTGLADNLVYEDPPRLVRNGLRYFAGLRGQLSIGKVTVRGQLTPDEAVEAPFFGVAGLDWTWFGVGAGVAVDRLRVSWTRWGLEPQDWWYPDPAVAAWGRSAGERHVDGRLMLTLTRRSGQVGFWPQRAPDAPIRYRLGASASHRSAKLYDPAGNPYSVAALYVGIEVAVELLRRDVTQVAPNVDTAGAP